MRILAEIFVLGALIYLGWEQPFKVWVDDTRRMLGGKQTTEVAPQQEQQVVPMTPTPRPAPRIVPGIIRQPTPPPSAWRLDPNHRSVLDRPAYDQTQSVRYRDASGRSYWIDAQGVRHYDQ
jgi:hypothetical protein